jgi:DNA-binding MarR family transcriptional regulator
MASSGNLWMSDGFESEWPGARATATAIVLNVVRAGMALHARVDALAQEYGLPSATSLGVLEVLRAENGPLQPSAIAQRLVSSRPALSGVLDSLQGRGLVRRVPHPASRRGVLIEITEAGVEAIERVLPELHRAEVLWTSALSEQAQRQLLACLDQLQTALLPDAGRQWPSK